MSEHTSSSNDDMENVTSDPREAFDTEPLIEVFAKPGNVRIMLTLVDAAGNPLPVSDIATSADIDKQTFYNNVDILTSYNLIEEADKVGNATRYRAKMDSETVQAFIHLYDALIGAA